MNKYLLENEIVEAELQKLTPTQKKEIIDNFPTVDDFQSLHFSYGMYIRNEYKLWDKQHPHQAQYKKDAVFEGVDYHPYHPDAISNRILGKIWKAITEIEPNLSTGRQSAGRGCHIGPDD